MSNVESTIDWNSLIFGHYSPSQIQWAVNDPDWQRFRIGLKGMPLNDRFRLLENWVDKHSSKRVYDMRSQIQVTNYVNALKRGGMIK